MYSIGLDVGTTGLKGLLVDGDGRVVAEALAAYAPSSPRPGWSEQAPEDWWAAAKTVLEALGRPDRPAAAVGLSGQMHGLVLLDRHGRSVAPAILWNDQRTAAECDEIVALTAGRIAAWTMVEPRTAFTATKLLWTRRHRPDAFAQATAMLLPKDFIRHGLTGDLASEVTDASGTNLLDVAARRWSAPTLAALELDPALLPPLVESPEVTGVIARAAVVAGVRAGTPVVGGAADQAAAAIGNGVTAAGSISITLGTSGVVYAQLPALAIDSSGAFSTFCHSVPGTWQMMATMLAAGGSVRWYRDVVGAADEAAAALSGQDVYQAIGEAVAAVAPGAEGLVFLPYLSGERSPHNDPAARGAWFGLSARHGRGHLARAVFEGVSMGLRDLVEILANGTAVDEVRVAGGGTRGPVWLRILADVLGRPIRTTATPDASAYGAAMLAMSHAAGVPVAALAGQWVRPGPPIEPDMAAHAAYAEPYAVFRALYPATKTLMARLTASAG